MIVDYSCSLLPYSILFSVRTKKNRLVILDIHTLAQNLMRLDQTNKTVHAMVTVVKTDGNSWRHFRQINYSETYWNGRVKPVLLDITG